MTMFGYHIPLAGFLNRTTRLGFISLILLSLFAFSPAQAARAGTTWTVCPSGCDFTTIADAVGSATDGDTILLNVVGVHTEPANVSINKGLTIEGLGMYTTIWQAADTPSFSNHRLLETDFNTPMVTVRNMTLRNGGSGTAGTGGTIIFSSPATLENLYIHHNYVQRTGGSAAGGAINAGEDITINHCLINDNIVQSDSAAYGGAIYAAMSVALTISNSTIANNQALGLPVDSGDGNSSYASGGGISFITSLTLSNSTVSGNLAKGSDVTNGTGGPARGGGIAGKNGFTANMTISNSTISSNEAIGGNGPTKGTAEGAGIYHYSGSLTFTTVYFNEVSGLNAKGGGMFRYSTGTMNLKNSIIANNKGAKDADGPDLYGTYNSQDYNLIYKTSGSTLNGTTTHNLTGVSPALLPLAENGGETQTHAPRLTSPVINAIPSGTNDCTPGSTIDQVYKNRPSQSGCEMGAYETPALYLPVVLR
jgi:hypothetical protein